MPKVRANTFSLSLDGYAAGPGQDLDNPLGRGGHALHDWFFPSATFRNMTGEDGGTTGIDDGVAARGMENLGAWILGRNMFGPIRGPWTDDSWKGWWGDNPPYHVPTFVLTHHAQPPIEMEGGTTFYFVTGGIEDALEQARQAAGDRDIRVGGGASTIRQYLKAQLLDELHLAITPILLGSGEALFTGIDLPALGYAVTDTVRGENAMHVVISRRS